MSKNCFVLAATVLSVIAVSSASSAVTNDHRSDTVSVTLDDRSVQAPIVRSFRIDEHTVVPHDFGTTGVESSDSHLVKAGLLSSIKKAAKAVGSGVKKAATTVAGGAKRAATAVAGTIKTAATKAAVGAGKVVRAIQRVFKKKPTKIVGF